MILNACFLRCCSINIIFSVQEYEEDGIDWTKVEFVDNQECLDLIEKVINGLPRFVFVVL